RPDTQVFYFLGDQAELSVRHTGRPGWIRAHKIRANFNGGAIAEGNAREVVSRNNVSQSGRRTADEVAGGVDHPNSGAIAEVSGAADIRADNAANHPMVAPAINIYSRTQKLLDHHSFDDGSSGSKA